MKNYKAYKVYLAFPLIMAACNGTAQEEKAIKLEKWEPVFESVAVPSETGSFYPRLRETEGRNELLMSWYTQEEGEATQLYSATYSSGWSEPQLVAQGENWFVNWADFPNISSYKGEGKAISYLQKNGEGLYSYEIKVKFFDPATGKWSEEALVPHQDNTQTEHGFVSMAPMKNEGLGLLWLDGRKYAEGAQEGHDSHGGMGEMTLRFAEISKEGEVRSRTRLDARTCDCCQTGMAATENGLLAVYRDRSPEEIRDVAFVRYQEGVWSEAEILYPDGWEIKGCPVNGPAIDASGKEVVVAWFTAAENQNRIKLIRSGDEGKTWQEPVIVDGERPVGRVDVRLLPDKSVLVSWLAADNQLKIQRINPKGEEIGTATVATVEGGRSVGFPQLAYKDGAIFLAWTETNKPKQVKLMSAKL